MDDLISRQAAIKELSKYVDYSDDGEQEINADIVFITLKEFPSAQPVIRTEMSSANDLISRQAAIDAVIRHLQLDRMEAWGVREAINALPSAERRGRWILADYQDEVDVANDNYRYNCSCCGKSDIHAKNQEVPFCWWCGADMMGEQE